MKFAQRAVLAWGLSVAVETSAWAQAPAPNPDGPYAVTLVPPVNGTVTLAPPLPPDGKYAKGSAS